jgi:hypothetical protein
MRNSVASKGLRSKIAVLAAASLIPISMVATSAHADVATAPINLSAPAGIPGVAPLPFTAVKAAAFTIPATMKNLTVVANQGPIGTAFTVTGSGLAVNTTMGLTWSTADGHWVTEVLPNTVNYLGAGYTKYSVNMTTVTTDATGGFAFTTKAPEDFGGVHDIYAIVAGVAVAHGGFQMTRTISISPTRGPVGTPITVTYTGMGASLYAGGAALLWDNNYSGEMQAQWTRGTARVIIRAAGGVGDHNIQVRDAINFAYLNVLQSPIPYANGGAATFHTTRDRGLIAPYITQPSAVTPSISARTTLTTTGLDPATKAIQTLSKTEGPILTKTTVNVTDLAPSSDYRIVWSTVVGNRVNCTGTCWAYNSIPLGTASSNASGVLSQEVTVPDNLGGFHSIQVLKGDAIQSQAVFYLQESIMPLYDKDGKLATMGVAKADTSGSLEAFQRGGAGAPTYTFKEGEEFTISMKGVGWTQMDNTLAVTYDNSYIGYGCGFNSNGYMVIHLWATGKPGTHVVDLYPLLYTNQPSFTNTPYGMVPVLSGDRDLPGLALGYKIPSVHFTIRIVK